MWTVDSVATLEPYLTGVQPVRWKHYVIKATPPCHSSKSGASFYAGDRPGGGVDIACWQPGCQGPGFYKRVGEALGIRILSRPAGTARSASRRAPQRSLVTVRPPALVWQRLPALSGHPITLGDLWSAPVFFAGAGTAQEGKHAATWTMGGAAQTFRHSRSPEMGGVRLARFGGEIEHERGNRLYRVQVHPWASFADIETLIANTTQLHKENRRPCLSLAGDDECPNPLALAVIDADYHAESDTEGRGRAYLASVRDELVSAGMPVFNSTNGGGFHAVFRLESAPDGRLYAPIVKGRRLRAFPVDAGYYSGARLEIFAPGDKRLIAIWRTRAIANVSNETPLPLQDWDRLLKLLEDARADAWPIVTCVDCGRSTQADWVGQPRRCPDCARGLLDNLCSRSWG